MKAQGLSENTLKIVSYRLKVLSKHCDLDDPEQVNAFIANLRGSNNYKGTFVKSYAYYVKHYGLIEISGGKIRLKSKEGSGAIPTT
jgi:hypothetical protein